MSWISSLVSATFSKPRNRVEAAQGHRPNHSQRDRRAHLQETRPKGAAGRLIDELGLKGETVGEAMVAIATANFIVNQGNATANDVARLVNRIRQRAWRERGVTLEMGADLELPVLTTHAGRYWGTDV